MKEQASAYRKIVPIGIAVAGWLGAVIAVRKYLTDVDVVGTEEVITALVVSLTALAYWFVWARPKLRESRVLVVIAPLVGVAIVSLIVDLVGAFPLADLAFYVSVSLMMVIEAEILI